MMNFFVSLLKSQLNVLSLVLIGLLIAVIFYKFHKKKVTFVLLILNTVFFLICSTAYLPRFLATKMERKFPPLDISLLSSMSGKIYIHVLGSGCSLDSTLPHNSRMGPVAHVRLTEAIRIFRQVNNSFIICSGGSESGEETQAEITRKAAILMGVDSNRIVTLTRPLTTMEEAKALKDFAGGNANVVIATDAIHMPRAIRFFTRQGFKPVAAPTNYRVQIERNQKRIKWWPNVNNILLMDVVIHEFLGSLKEGG